MPVQQWYRSDMPRTYLGTFARRDTLRDIRVVTCDPAFPINLQASLSSTISCEITAGTLSIFTAQQ